MVNNSCRREQGSGTDFSVIRDAILSQRSVPITQLQSEANSTIAELKHSNNLIRSSHQAFLPEPRFNCVNLEREKHFLSSMVQF